MSFSIIKSAVDKHLYSLAGRRSLSEIEKAAFEAIRTYSYNHIAGAATIELSALKTIINANDVVSKSGLFDCRAFFAYIHSYCSVQINKATGSGFHQEQTSTSSHASSDVNYYILLGVKENATLEELREAYRKLVLKYHPDVNGSKEAADMFIKVKHAYDVLSNADSRKLYDSYLAQDREDTIQKTRQADQSASYHRTSENNKPERENNKPKKENNIDNDEIGYSWHVVFFCVVAIVILISIVKSCQTSSTQSDNIDWKQEVIDKISDEAIEEKLRETLDTMRFTDIINDKSKTNPSKKNKAEDKKVYTLPQSYTETHYSTGDVPYIRYWGKGKFDYNSLSELEIVNYSSTDAVVLLQNSLGKVIRNVFITQGTTYTMKNIPEGTYILKTMHGNSWNSLKDNGANFPKGGFMNDVRFEKSEWSNSLKFYFEETDEGINYPTYSVTLHKVRNGNMTTETIDNDEFWD